MINMEIIKSNISFGLILFKKINHNQGFNPMALRDYYPATLFF